MKKTMLFLMLGMFLISFASAEMISYGKGANGNDDLKVEVRKNFLFVPTGKLGEAELKSHPSVNYVKQVSPGKQVTMYYDFNFGEIYRNGLGEVIFIDQRTGEEVERDWRYVYLTEEEYEVPVYSQEKVWNQKNQSYSTIQFQTGTETKTREVWKEYNSRDLPKGQIRIGIEVEVRNNDYIDGVWEVGGKKINKHAEWEASLETDLVSWWGLNETSGSSALDYLNNNSGTYAGDLPTAVAGVSEITNNSQDFDGTGDYVQINGGFSSLGNEFTISQWIKTTDTTNQRWSFWFGMTSHGEFDGFELPATSNLINLRVRDNGNPLTLSSISNVRDGNWHLVTLVYNDGGVARAYIDGIEEDNGSLSNPSSIVTDTFNLGQRTGGNNYYDGQIDETFIYDRALSQSEITTLYNDGNGCTYQLCGAGEEGLTINLVSPANDTQLNDETVNFKSEIILTNANVSNATLSVWDSDGVLFHNSTNTSISGNESLNVSFSVSNFESGKYYWNVEAFGFETGNTSNILNGTADNNFTFEWVPFEVSGEDYNNDTYETRNESFMINISVDNTVTNLGSFLVYNDSLYAAEHSCSNGLCQLETEIDIPLNDDQSVDSENNAFHWQITLFGSFGTFSTTTTSHNQNSSKINFTNNANGNTKTVDYLIYNESLENRSSLEQINADFDSVFRYYLGTGSVSKTYNLSLTGESNYSFYINHDLDFNVNATIQLKNETERTYFLMKEIYNSTLTEQELFLPHNDVTGVIVEVKDQGLIPIEGYLVEVYRFYPATDSYKLVESKKTDEFGQITAKLVQNDVKYKFQFYDSNRNLKKTSEHITIACRSSFCTVPFVIEVEDDEFDRFEDLALLSYELSFNNNTNIFSFIWDDQRQESQTFRFEVTRYTLNQSETVCNQNSTSNVAALTCSVGSERASYRAQVFRTINGEDERRIAVLNLQVGSPYDVFGVEGLFWVFILLFICVGIGAFNPTVAALLYGFGFIIFGVIGIISMPLPVFFANTLLVALFVWAVKT